MSTGSGRRLTRHQKAPVVVVTIVGTPFSCRRYLISRAKEEDRVNTDWQSNNAFTRCPLTVAENEAMIFVLGMYGQTIEEGERTVWKLMEQLNAGKECSEW